MDHFSKSHSVLQKNYSGLTIPKIKFTLTEMISAWIMIFSMKADLEKSQGFDKYWTKNGHILPFWTLNSFSVSDIMSCWDCWSAFSSFFFPLNKSSVLHKIQNITIVQVITFILNTQ